MYKPKIGNLAVTYSRAENETRTRDPDLGKVVLYQLSYFRVYPKREGKDMDIFDMCKQKR